MFRSVSKLPTAYLFCLIFVLFLVGLLINTYRPETLFGATYISQITFGFIQIIIGLAMLALVFAVIMNANK